MTTALCLHVRHEYTNQSLAYSNQTGPFLGFFPASSLLDLSNRSSRQLRDIFLAIYLPGMLVSSDYGHSVYKVPKWPSCCSHSAFRLSCSQSNHHKPSSSKGLILALWHTGWFVLRSASKALTTSQR